MVSLPLLILLSAFSSMIYQMVWIRIAMSTFGSIFPILSSVISSNMFGLFLGASLTNFLVRNRTTAKQRSLIYVSAHLLIALGSLIIPLLFAGSSCFLQTFPGLTNDSHSFVSCILVGLCVLPWSTAIGLTFPLASTLFKGEAPGSSAFTITYPANVVGSLAGIFLGAYVLIEVLGVQGTLFFTGAVSVITAILGRYHFNNFRNTPVPLNPITAVRKASILNVAVFIVGFCSLGFELVWVKCFTPFLEITVYAFALLLLAHFSFVTLGSLFVKNLQSRGVLVQFDWIFLLISFTAFLPVVVDLDFFFRFPYVTLLTLGPVSFSLGMVFPLLIERLEHLGASDMSASYARGSLGSFLGSMISSFILIPTFGVKGTVIAFSFSFLALAFLVPSSSGTEKRFRKILVPIVLGLCFIHLSMKSQNTDEFTFFGKESKKVIKKDTAFTAVGFSTGPRKWLFVNGILTAVQTEVTKNMAHIPLAFFPGAPKRGLVICLGMGQTFNSMASWGLETTVVELSRAVSELLPFFLEKVPIGPSYPGNKIVVDDGKRFLLRTQESFDVITVDPPPPIEASGSSQLYSVDFYRLVKKRLSPEGVFHQWIFSETPREKPRPAILGLQDSIENDNFLVLLRSIQEVFPYVRVFQSVHDSGYHVLASPSPIPAISPALMLQKMPVEARKDFLASSMKESPENLARKILHREMNLHALVPRENVPLLTDDRPYNEYFFLRRLWNNISP